MILIPTLGFATPIHASPPAAATEIAVASDYERALGAAAAANDPKALEVAIAGLVEYRVELTDDERGQDTLANARLRLTLGYLKLEDQAAAERTMDEAIRDSFARPLPVEDHGPSVQAFAGQRKLALDEAGQGRIVVSCPDECLVFVGHTRVGLESPPLYLGRYLVRVKTSSGMVITQTVDVGHDGDVASIELPNAPPIQTPSIQTRPPEVPATVTPTPAPPAPALVDGGAAIEVDEHADLPPDGRPRRPGLYKGGIALTVLGTLGALVAGGALAARGTTGFMLDRSNQGNAAPGDDQVIHAYGVSGTVAFGALIATSIMLPIGITGILVGKGRQPRAMLRAGSIFRLHF